MKNIIVHYSEIGLKGKNRSLFEKKLMDNIRRSFKDSIGVTIKRMSGRIVLTLDKKEDWPLAKEKLNKIFGIKFFAQAQEVKQNIEQIKKQSLILIKNQVFNSFAVRVKRSEKSFSLKSIEVERDVGAYLLQNLTDKKVNLKNPDVICHIEIVEKQAFIFLNKEQGPGGLPVGVSGKVVVLLSGGFDSPIATWQLMKRGAEVILVHYHSYPNTSKASLEKVQNLSKVLSKYQPNIKLYLVPFLNIQKKISREAIPKLRVILYRRQMMRIAQYIAKKEKALALVTGDSLGQVASQTLENMRAISEAVDLPIFRPLIGFDKEEIINLSKEIGTYHISKEPFDDCCSLFMPKRPETKAGLKEVIMMDKKIGLEKEMSNEEQWEIKQY